MNGTIVVWSSYVNPKDIATRLGLTKATRRVQTVGVRDVRDVTSLSGAKEQKPKSDSARNGIARLRD